MTAGGLISVADDMPLPKMRPVPRQSRGRGTNITNPPPPCGLRWGSAWPYGSARNRGLPDSPAPIQIEEPMAKTISLSLSEDELEMLIDALEVDLEGYQDSAKEARGNNNREDVKTFTEAAERIEALIAKLRALNPEG
jgi:hypothetical protein